MTVHKPVLVKEVLHFLKPSTGIYLDATVGTGGHSAEILKRIRPPGFLIGMDIDQESLKIAEDILSTISNRYRLFWDNYLRMAERVREMRIDRVDGVLLDAGVSSFQLDSPERGFSFRHPGPLDMRFNRSENIPLKKILEGISQRDLERALRLYGEEKFASSIARRIKMHLRRLTTTTDLASLVAGVYRSRRQSTKIHPATRTFQALRILVNEELRNLSSVLEIALGILAPGGKVLVISYHSLEDRIVKQRFTRWRMEGRGAVMTRKPIYPSVDEIQGNPRARSARLRIFQKFSEN